MYVDDFAQTTNLVRDALLRSASPKLKEWIGGRNILTRDAMKALLARRAWRKLATMWVADLQKKEGLELSEELSGLSGDDAAETVYWRLLQEEGDVLRRQGYEERAYAVPYLKAWLTGNTTIKPAKGVSIWTSAPASYDAVSTNRTGEVYIWLVAHDRPTRLERVFIRPDNLQWQIDRYLSGMVYAAMDDERLAKEQEYDKKKIRMAEFASAIGKLRESKEGLKFLPVVELERRIQALHALPEDIQREEWRTDRELRDALSAAKELARLTAEQGREENRIMAAVREILTPPASGMVFVGADGKVVGTLQKMPESQHGAAVFTKHSIYAGDLLRRTHHYQWIKDPVPGGTPQAVWDAGANPENLRSDQVDGVTYYVWRAPGSFDLVVVKADGKKAPSTSKAYKAIQDRRWR